MTRPLPIPAAVPIPADNPDTFTVDDVTYTNPFADDGCDCD